MKRLYQKLKIILQCNYFYYFLLIINIIYIVIYVNNYKIKSSFDINDNQFIVTIDSVKIDGNKLSIEFREKLIGTYYFDKEEDKNSFNYEIGDKLKIYGNLKLPKNNTIPNTFNYKKYLNRKGIKYILSIDKFSLISKSNNILIKFKNYIYKRISNIEHNDYLYALILGKTDYMDIDTYNNYRINGVTHLFSLSGLHVSMFSMIILCILNKLKINEIFSFIITTSILFIFSFVASFSPSILRASIIFILNNIKKIFKLNIKTKYLLYLTFVILTFVNPNYIFNMGFILSFTITYFIILIAENYKIKNSLINIIIISFISFLASAPIMINNSYEINIIGFLNNVIFIPYVTYIVFPLTLINMIFPFLNELLNILVIIMEKISFISTNILNLNIYFSKLNVFLIFMYYCLLILIIKKKNKLIIPFIFLIIYAYIKPNFNNDNYIYFLDVSQGDSILILNKNNESFLIDTGGKVNYEKDEWEVQRKPFNLMISTIIPFFRSIGLKKIDYLIITHGDYDHIGDAINLINNFKVNKVILNNGEYNNLELDFIEILKQNNIPYYKNLQKLNTKNNKLLFLNSIDYKNENDNSLVIYTKIYEYKVLLMADAGVKVEHDLINKYNLRNIDILKIGHHGSNTSSDKKFINLTNPKYSIISVGENNRYGHPNKEVLNNLDNSKIYRTDQDGSIMFKIKNNNLKIKTYSP